jgi:hypothetical protein
LALTPTPILFEPQANSRLALIAWASIFGIVSLSEIAALVLGILGWKSASGKAAFVVALALPLLGLPFFLLLSCEWRQSRTPATRQGNTLPDRTSLPPFPASPPFGRLKTQYGFVALTRDGRDVEPGGSREFGFAPLLTETSEFPVKLTEVRAFFRRTRAIQTTGFNNTPLPQVNKPPQPL